MGKMIDLTGQRFERLVALYPVRKNSRLAWHCKCDCGNECDIDSGNLRSGRQKSCGCLKQQSGKTRKKDLVGQKFGRLTVIKATDERSSGAIVWECQCDCGNKTKVSTGNLRSGHTQSCGCYAIEKISEVKRVDLRGHKFGILTAVNSYHDDAHKWVMWHCKCECGKTREVRTGDLTSGAVISCGCEKIRSKGEELIRNLLLDAGISFVEQKTFDSCRFPDTQALAKFDFYVDNKYLIEYDGKQHFQQSQWEPLKDVQRRDAYKTQWCRENHIPLVRIPYTRLKELKLQDLIL